MKGHVQQGEIRTARCMIDDRHTFLERLKSISREYSTNIICFNADMLAGRVHAELAVRLARRSWMGECAIANTFEMEALLYAAGSRQCNVASRFGINDGENHLFICCNPGGNERVWAALSPFLEYVDTERFEITDQNKRERLIDLFSITPLELGSLDTGTTITDLILERVALLQVLR